MFVVLKCEICSLKSTFDCFHVYSRFDVYFLCITLWTVCISREIIIETFTFLKTKMSNTTGDQLSIIWLVLRCAKCSSVMFDIIGKLKFWINNILTSIDFYAEIQAINRTQVIQVFHDQKTPGQRKLLKKYLRSFPYSSCLLINANCLRNSFHQMKNNVYLHSTQMENTTDKK
jgi:hypothetical protein